jgi:hypothetical protein
MSDKSVLLSVSVRHADIPENETPQPTLEVVTSVTNNGRDKLVVSAEELLFELVGSSGEVIEELPIANPVIDDDSRHTTIASGTTADVTTSLKFEPTAVATAEDFSIRVSGFNETALAEFQFED